MAGQKPQWKVLVSRQSEGSDKTYYTEIGSAWNVAKDGISVQLNATPIHTLLLIRAPRRLAIDRDDLGRRVRQRRDQGHEAKLKGAGVERGKDIAEMIMRRRAIHIGPKPPQQINLPLAKSGDVGERLRPRKNRQKNQQKDFRQRIINFARLTMIRQTIEMV